MTPERRQKLITAIELIETSGAATRPSRVEACRSALIGMGAKFSGGNTNTLRLAGVTATSTWSDGHMLIASWWRKAKDALDKAEAEEDGQ